MILQMDDWEFDIDMERTMAHSAAEAAEHCTCAYCRNFYAAVDEYCPNLRPFLARFGIDIEAPDEQMPYDFQGEMYYDSVYMVCGRIVKIGAAPIGVDGVKVRPAAGRGPSDAIHLNHNCPVPCFALDVSTVILPWVLDEPMEETVSPANEPAFLKKMWGRLLSRIRPNAPKS